MNIKRKMLIILLALIFLLVTTSCVSFLDFQEDTSKISPAITQETVTAPVPQKTYQVGTMGPAGGLVFYDKGSYSDGWRYLEMAPEETDMKEMAWGGSGIEIKNTSPNIGTGLENTKIIISLIGNNDKKQGSSYPALLCDSLVYNGFEDWFLPSIEELKLIYNNLIVPEIGGFTKNAYGSIYSLWSSTVDTSGNNYLAFAFNLNSDNGSISGSSRDFPGPHVRAIRRF